MTADHGPAVSGAHNTIVTARAGKDLVSALCSGLLTIGPRFGGALDKAAEMFTQVRLILSVLMLQAGNDLLALSYTFFFRETETP